METLTCTTCKFFVPYSQKIVDSPDCTTIGNCHYNPERLAIFPENSEKANNNWCSKHEATET